MTEAQRKYREEYLTSEHWLTVRLAALDRAKHRCQVCNGAKQLDVHHRTYERLGNENPEDLTVLCRACHEIFHESKSVRRDPKKAKQGRRPPKRRRQPKNVGYSTPRTKKLSKAVRLIEQENERLAASQRRNRESREAQQRQRAIDAQVAEVIAEWRNQPTNQGALSKV